jgi:hypothetical protein
MPASNLLQGTLDLLILKALALKELQARYYRLTKAGQRQLGIEAEEWDKISVAMAAALKAI